MLQFSGLAMILIGLLVAGSFAEAQKTDLTASRTRQAYEISVQKQMPTQPSVIHFQNRMNSDLLKNMQAKRYESISAKELLGPGRSGGGNGAFSDKTESSSRLLDQQEVSQNAVIQNWEAISAFVNLKAHLQNYPNLKEYLLEAFKSKKWFWTYRDIPAQGCLNATLSGTNKGQQVVACQWQTRGLILRTRFDQLSLQDQLQLLIHEGLVHHMVSSLNRMEAVASKVFVDQAQETMEFSIHVLSEKILKLQFNNIYELNDDLKKNGFPTLLTAEEDKIFYSHFEGKKSIDVFVGAEEKTALMEKYFESGAPVDMAGWSKKLGLQACFINADGYSAPGYYAGGFIKFDQMFPSAFFTLYAFKDIDLPEDVIKQAMQQNYLEAGLHVPLSYNGRDWTGDITIDVKKKFEKVFKTLKDPKEVQDMRDLLKKQLGENIFNLHQHIRLTVRSIKTPYPDSHYIVMKRELVSSENPNVTTVDYISGNLQRYPECLKVNQ